MSILCGTCAWADHHGFYPKSIRPSQRLAYYARMFPIVEVDSTYYGIPKSETVLQWIEQSPASFVFDVKAYRTMTFHDRGKATETDRMSDFAAFQQAIGPLLHAGRLGVVLLQYPPWFVKHGFHQSLVEAAVQRLQPASVAVEFRHRSWWTAEAREETRSWLQDLEVCNVVCDEPQVGMGTIPFVPDVTSNVVVFRLHGRNAEKWYEKGLTSSQQRFDYLYSKEELTSFLPYVQEWVAAAEHVHILMNNNQGNYAVTNALDWLQLLGSEVQHTLPEPSQQLSLFDSEDW